ncbi:sugar transferase [Aurantimonas sp. DM33-3]|uniref:sugar transferase n=1 Tax=Aurantimonas sp. DM33-3 TaxID=2766955 RepID=UPI0016521D2A|nr:sugar transferase [Aurantimonas sp. DM33-3]MBC6715565.1 sugar transferase [Aurantimonas sp. DM33-3]
MSDLSFQSPYINGEFRDRRARRYPTRSERQREAERRKGPSLWKRPIDVTFALAGLIFFAPLLILISLALLISDNRPIIYRQKRVGMAGRTFECLKFRTMRRDSDEMLARLLADCPVSAEEWAAARKLSRDPRVHAIGNILRRSSLDELPQLINVLRGEMSLVGPRPIVEAEVAYYGENFFAYQAVRPGITGLWQVSGRNTLPYATRVRLDAYYVRQLSLANDLLILVKTLPIVVLARGDYSK